MTEQEKKVKFKQAIDHTLSGLQGDPFLYQRVAANAEEGEKTVKYRFPKGLVIALIVILSMGAVAVAASVYGGTVNWLGEVILDENVPAVLPTMAPAMEGTTELDEDDLDQLVREGAKLLVSQTMDDGEIIPYASVRMKRTALNMEEFYVLLAGDENLPIPNFIPEGYEFVRAEVYYDCRAGSEWQLIDRQELAAGFSAEWYGVAQSDELISGYHLFFRESPEDYHYLSVDAMLTETQNVQEQTFGFLAGMTARAVQVPGMDYALIITSDHSCTLSMLRELKHPIDYLYFMEAGWQEIQTFTEVDMSVSAPLLDVDTLVRMFAAG